MFVMLVGEALPWIWLLFLRTNIREAHGHTLADVSAHGINLNFLRTFDKARI